MIVKKRVTELTPSEYRTLSSLTMRESGLMQGELRAARFAKETHPLCYMLMDGDEIKAWAYTFREPKKRYDTVYYYTRQKYRKQGLGNVLMKACLKDHKKLRIKPWSTTSGSFFADYADHLICDKWEKTWLKKRRSNR